MPYNPGVQPRGADYLFQGISQAGASVGEMIAQMKQRARQTTAMRSMAVDGLGMDPDQVDKMSLPQLTGTLHHRAPPKHPHHGQAYNVQRFGQSVGFLSQAMLSRNDPHLLWIVQHISRPLKTRRDASTHP
jgi:hypothetical protein